MLVATARSGQGASRPPYPAAGRGNGPRRRSRLSGRGCSVVSPIRSHKRRERVLSLWTFATNHSGGGSSRSTTSFRRISTRASEARCPFESRSPWELSATAPTIHRRDGFPSMSCQRAWQPTATKSSPSCTSSEQQALVRFPASVGIWDRVSPDPGLNLSLEDRSRFRRALKALKARPVSLSSWAPRDRHVGSLPGQADPSLRQLNSIVPIAPRLQLSHHSCIDGDRLHETREVCANLARFIGPLDR